MALKKYLDAYAPRVHPGVLLILSILVFLFFLTGHVLLSDIYRYAAVGAVFELLLFPMLLLLVVVPMLCLICLFRAKGRGYAAAALLLIAGTIFILAQAS